MRWRMNCIQVHPLLRQQVAWRWGKVWTASSSTLFTATGCLAMRQRMKFILLHPLYGNRLLGDEAKDELRPAAPSLRQQVAWRWGKGWTASSSTLFTATGCLAMRQSINCIQLHPLYGNRLLRDGVVRGWGKGWIAWGYTLTATGCLAMRQRMSCIQLHPLYGNRLLRDGVVRGWGNTLTATGCLGMELFKDEARDELREATPLRQQVAWQWGEGWTATCCTLHYGNYCTGMELRQRMNCIQLHPLYGNRHAQPAHQQLSFSDKVAGTGIHSRISPWTSQLLPGPFVKSDFSPLLKAILALC